MHAHAGMMPRLHYHIHAHAGASACRHAKSQRAQVVGQAVGLPLCMAAFTFTGLAVTSATQAIFGRIISDPVELLSQLSNPWAVALGLLGVAVIAATPFLPSKQAA